MLEFLNPEDERDVSTRKGAERLARIIVEFWRERGFDVTVRVHPGGKASKVGGLHYELQSSLIDGLPTKALFQEKDAA